jgi:hypothetical protein
MTPPKRVRPTLDLAGKQRLLEEIAAAQCAAELNALTPAWGAWFDCQPDGPALDAAMSDLHDAWSARLAPSTTPTCEPATSSSRQPRD